MSRLKRFMSLAMIVKNIQITLNSCVNDLHMH